MSGSKADRTKADDQIAAIGIAAFPRVMQEAKRQPAGDLRNELNALAGRLSCVVRTIEGVGEPAVLQSRLDSLKGKPLLSENILTLIRVATQGSPANAPGLGITIDRDTDGMGVSVRVDCGIQKSVGASGNGIAFSFLMILNGAQVSGESGSTSREYFESTLEVLKDDLDECFSSDPLAPFLIKLSFAASGAVETSEHFGLPRTTDVWES